MFSDRNPSGPAQEDQSVLGKGTLWKGEIVAGRESLRIEGTLEGTITSEGRVTVASAGVVKGTIRAGHLIVTGRAEGRFHVADCMEIHGSGWVEGDMDLGSLVVDEGSTLQGTCTRHGVTHTVAEGAPDKPAAPAPARHAPPPRERAWRPLTVFLALVAAVLAGGLAWWRFRPVPPPPEVQAPAPAPVESPAPAPKPAALPPAQPRPVPAPRPRPEATPERAPAPPRDAAPAPAPADGRSGGSGR